jgi:anti-sigma-K factor RskA
MTMQDDIDMLAGEYALGTLDAVERASVESRRRREPQLEAAIVAWERRLDPMNARTPSVEPPTDLFGRIEARLRESAPAQASRGVNDAVVIQLQRRVKQWRWATAAAAALAACLALVVLARETIAPRQPESFVAIFNENDMRPSFLMSVDLRTKEMIIRPIGAERQAGKSYQLWIVAKSFGPAPHSLGLLESLAEPTRKGLPGIDLGELRNATFGISIEPEGGSPTGRPTGPAIHGRLLPATL